MTQLQNFEKPLLLDIGDHSQILTPSIDSDDSLNFRFSQKFQTFSVKFPG